MDHSKPADASAAIVKQSGKNSEQNVKEKRLAEALRKNLLRRKAVTKASGEPAEGSR